MMTTQQQIRNELKEAGYKARAISVTKDGSATYIRIKDATINIDDVKKIADKHKLVHRCEYSGEILSGGNHFVFVDYDRKVLNEAAKVAMPKAEEIFANKKDQLILKTDAVIISYYVERNRPVVSFRTDDDSEQYSAYSANEIAKALIMIEAKLTAENKGKLVSPVA